MKRNRIAAAVVFVQAIILPILYGSLADSDRVLVLVLQTMIAILCVGVFTEKMWAIWTAFVLMAVQIPMVEAERITWRVTAGSSLSVGVFKSESWLDSRLGLNLFSGYVFNGAIFRSPTKRLLTDGREVTGAFMLNLAVVPAAVLLLSRLASKDPNKANQALEPTGPSGHGPS
jgi:hypothetical protein